MSALIYGVLSFGPGLVVKSTPVQYAGSAPTVVCGVVQINFQVPVNQAPGTFSFLPWIQLVDGNTTSSLRTADRRHNRGEVNLGYETTGVRGFPRRTGLDIPAIGYTYSERYASLH